jgi:hypothetical protein
MSSPVGKLATLTFNRNTLRDFPSFYTFAIEQLDSTRAVWFLYDPLPLETNEISIMTFDQPGTTRDRFVFVLSSKERFTKFASLTKSEPPASLDINIVNVRTRPQAWYLNAHPHVRERHKSYLSDIDSSESKQ